MASLSGMCTGNRTGTTKCATSQQQNRESESGKQRSSPTESNLRERRLNSKLLDLLCDPVSREPLRLRDEVVNSEGRIVSGVLETPSGRRYPVKNGIPRFLQGAALSKSVESFGNEW